jgi:NAD(P)-dependent dehydrogenase (short-subunit alcohol dehydrogenase family)
MVLLLEAYLAAGLCHMRACLSADHFKARIAEDREDAMKRLEGKVALVTGAASGIGRASALLFAAEGAKVVAVDKAAEVAATAKAIVDGGGEAQAVEADASLETNIADAVDTATARYGTLDVMFANAGVSGGLKPFLELDAEDWLGLLKINLVGAYLALKHAARVMVPKGAGSIVCTASVAGLRSGAGGAPYSASKAGVISLVQTSANFLAGTGVRVNAICPGLIETGMTKPIFEYARSKGTGDRIGQLNPLRRYGEAEEIAHMALFLASDEASYVNGQAIPVDGGLSSSHPVRGKWS